MPKEKTIKWRNRTIPFNFRVITGLSRYSSRQAAERQVVIWERWFPENTYYIE